VISRDQARSLADLVNSKKAPGGCDGNYAGTCVPDNATSVHCVGAPGDGPAVRGPFTIAGWDSFELDPDGDKHVCDSPVGSFDVFGQELGGIAIRGWAFDPDTTDPIQLVISTNGFIDQVPADESRGDLAAVLPGVGANHGFDLVAEGFDVDSSNAVCVIALNVGTGTNTTLGCKTIVISGPGEFATGSGPAYAMLEGADVVPGGIHVRGFVVNTTGSLIGQQIYSADGGEGAGLPLTVVRDDVADVFGAPTGVAYGFDAVIPNAVKIQPTNIGNPFVNGACLIVGNTFPGSVMNCRALNS
jgi:hypothetical protein